MAKKRKDVCHPTTEELRQEMYRVSQALKDAYEHFNWADDPDLIDACIFEINACKARYNYLLRCVKERSGIPIQHAHAYPVPGHQAAAVSCVAAANVKGGDICRL